MQDPGFVLYLWHAQSQFIGWGGIIVFHRITQLTSECICQVSEIKALSHWMSAYKLF